VCLPSGRPAHRSAAVQRWLARHAGRVELFFLPGYSPDLNPDEFLNQDVKSNALGRRRPAIGPGPTDDGDHDARGRAKWIWKQVAAHLPRGACVVDVFHVSEHLHTCGRVLHGETTPQARGWAEERLMQLLRDGPLQLLTALRDERPR
jgi:hypothetical protein